MITETTQTKHNTGNQTTNNSEGKQTENNSQKLDQQHTPKVKQFLTQLSQTNTEEEEENHTDCEEYPEQETCRKKTKG